MNKQQLQKLRGEYSKNSLDESRVDRNPIKQFEKWMFEALESGVPEPNAMILATVDANHKPKARVVLLKEVDDGSFIFYTNYSSDKGKELQQNPNASLCFMWLELERQVRIEGVTEKIPKSVSEEYFKQRPYQSQLGALASNQSEVVEGREVLEDRFDELEKKYNEGEVPMPDTWGGYRLIPEAIEFWQGRRSRLHDRVKYELQNGNWTIKRLSP
ncbi:MAG: pyridoxamine 5'-phosphate oxidase [Gracilimonas sp.]|uniref:pyridoxamine 5'-phosphate oxidase n=1 Tax=Gracilimonas sp. TaxID=1974203 RepID=UPI0019C90980|nr:pyridoxamine 5'-phosphate oxidase [Gracilimonas sp.]MBD3616420.1 pyridoxamine 5'-phosphate oxidase [Gracilimonas sp.]